MEHVIRGIIGTSILLFAAVCIVGNAIEESNKRKDRSRISANLRKYEHAREAIMSNSSLSQQEKEEMLISLAAIAFR